MSTSFNVNQNDLEFILKQIKIAEATSAAYSAAPKTQTQAIMDAYGVTPAVAQQLPYGLRTVDGTYNSLIAGQSELGAADTLFPRLTDPVFRNDQDGDVMPLGPGAPTISNTNYALIGNVADADPRIISNLIVDMTAGNPAAVEAALKYSVFTGAIAEDDVAAAAAAIAASYAATIQVRIDAVAASANLTLLTNALAAAISQQGIAATAYQAALDADPYRVSANLADVSDNLAVALAGVGGAIDIAGLALPGLPIDQTDLDNAAAAVGAAQAAYDAAGLVTDELTSEPGVDPAHVAAAQAVEDAANTILGLLQAYQTALTNLGLGVDPSVEVLDAMNAVVTAATGHPGVAQALTATLASQVDLSGDIANTLAALTAANTAVTDADAALTNALNNLPDVAAADAALDAVLDSNGIAHDPLGSLVIPNQSPDIGLSPGFNSWMTFFGQFFDHGLDLVTKGNAGTVYIPLAADDPLIAGADGVIGTADDLPQHLRFMALTRATQTVVDGVPQHENTTTSFVDQNQTYTSHASHQVFLREYVRADADTVVATGRLLDGSAASGSVAGAIGNWAEVKAQALTMLGIQLSDFDVHNVPLLVTDQYGKFIPGANGYAQLVMAPDATHATNWLKEGTAAGITTEGSLGTGHAFLNDIAHHAAPQMVDHDHDGGVVTPKIAQVADADNVIGDDHNELTYDNEMLNSHFVTGDGRGNENIALTAVHAIFHAEHNRLVEASKATILASGNLAFINEWLRTDIASLTAIDTQAEKDALIDNDAAWDGERLFQAARFSTEMQYQHLVFEEFARRIQPMVDPFTFNNSPNVDPAIVAEFAHTVYRFGHSMLTGTVDRLENDLTLIDGTTDQQTLLAAFLNPQAYIGSGATLDEINANLIRGLTRDVGNAIDEFIVQDVRSNLLGLPLDLAVLNIARGRDTGIPSLNETRAQLYADTGLADLKPYTSWADFAANIKNAASIVNFIAAYGTHPLIEAAATLAEKRAVAEEIVFGVEADGVTPSDIAGRLDFLNGTGAYATGLSGLNLVDLWIGGLAEANPEFGGMLGSTFNYVFEAQMENLQNGDRFYYLTRTQGLNFLNQLEPNTFADLVMRNTDLGDDYATHLSGQIFMTPDYILELDKKIAQENYGPIDYNGADPGSDPTWAPGEPHSVLVPNKVMRDYTTPVAGVAPTVGGDGHNIGGTIRFTGGEHVVLGGTEGNDALYGDKGIDTLWGDGGNDYLNAGTESDDVFGNEGDDIIEDPFGDDVLRGNQGNDVISSARGADLLFGGEGKDTVLVGQDASEVFAGARVHELLRQIWVGRQVQVGEEDVVRTEPCHLVRLRFLDLDYQLGFAEGGVGVGHDRRPLAGIVCVAEGRPLPRSRLNEHRVAAVGEFASAGRRQGHPVLVRFRFCRDPYSHRETKIR